MAPCANGKRVWATITALAEARNLRGEEEEFMMVSESDIIINAYNDESSRKKAIAKFPPFGSTLAGHALLLTASAASVLITFELMEELTISGAPPPLFAPTATIRAPAAFILKAPPASLCRFN